MKFDTSSNNAIKENSTVEKPAYSAVSIKDLIAKNDVQEALKKYIEVPSQVMVKKVKKPFTNESTKSLTQKVEGLSGTTLENAENIEFTLVGTELPVPESLNKLYRFVDYTVALEANMSGGKFGGYSAKGLKLLVTKIEEVKNGE